MAWSAWGLGERLPSAAAAASAAAELSRPLSQQVAIDNETALQVAGQEFSLEGGRWSSGCNRCRASDLRPGRQENGEHLERWYCTGCGARPR